MEFYEMFAYLPEDVNLFRKSLDEKVTNINEIKEILEQEQMIKQDIEKDI